MVKPTAPFELLLPPCPAKMPACRWLYGTLRAEILEGRLRPGSRLPATRDLARQYELSRGTIVSAFEDLKAEGYLISTQGSGTYVNHVLPEHLLQVAAKPSRQSSAAAHPPRRLSR